MNSSQEQFPKLNIRRRNSVSFSSRLPSCSPSSNTGRHKPFQVEAHTKNATTLEVSRHVKIEVPVNIKKQAIPPVRQGPKQLPPLKPPYPPSSDTDMHRTFRIEAPTRHKERSPVKHSKKKAPQHPKTTVVPPVRQGPKQLPPLEYYPVVPLHARIGLCKELPSNIVEMQHSTAPNPLLTRPEAEKKTEETREDHDRPDTSQVQENASRQARTGLARWWLSSGVEAKGYKIPLEELRKDTNLTVGSSGQSLADPSLLLTRREQKKETEEKEEDNVSPDMSEVCENVCATQAGMPRKEVEGSVEEVDQPRRRRNGVCAATDSTSRKRERARVIAKRIGCQPTQD